MFAVGDAFSGSMNLMTKSAACGSIDELEHGLSGQALDQGDGTARLRQREAVPRTIRQGGICLEGAVAMFN